MKTNQEYKDAALSALKGNWAPAVVATIVFFAIGLTITGGQSLSEAWLPLTPGVLGTVFGASLLLTILVVGPLEIGYYNSTKALYEDGDSALTRNIFNLGFKNYIHNVWGYLLMCIKIFLWCLLFFIPGIIKAFAYAMTPFILVENPEMKAIDAIHKSQELMKGHKFDLFYLELSFIGWILLGILTLGIGYLWLLPYMQTSIAAFYDDLKTEAETGYSI